VDRIRNEIDSDQDADAVFSWSFGESLRVIGPLEPKSVDLPNHKQESGNRGSGVLSLTGKKLSNGLPLIDSGIEKLTR
jgi:hypothetical protein